MKMYKKLTIAGTPRPGLSLAIFIRRNPILRQPNTNKPEHASTPLATSARKLLITGLRGLYGF